MKDYKTIYKVLPFFILGLLFFVTLVNYGVGVSGDKQKQKLIIANKTSGFEVIESKTAQGMVELSFRNAYKKSITAYVVSIGDHFTFTEEFIYSEVDFAIRPGEPLTKGIPLPFDLSSKQTVPLTILAVVFEDRTGEGDQEILRGIEDERLGEKVQVMRILSLLEEVPAQANDSRQEMAIAKRLKSRAESALSKGEAETLADLKSVKPRGAGPDLEVRSDLSEQFKNGLQTGRETILRKIYELKEADQPHNDSYLNEQMARLKEYYRKLIARL
jgi:hypothetical protein